MPGIASSSPPVLLAHLASVTSTIRVGSGGVMLPNHAPLTVAEQFGMLEALHPGRIDLGIGRAPGTDPLTAPALRRGPGCSAPTTSPSSSAELLGYFDGALPEGHPYEHITAVPARGYRPRSGCSARAPTARTAAAVPRVAVLVRVPLRAGDARRRARRVPQRVPTVGRARRALRDARRVGDLRARPTSTRTGSPAPGVLAFLRLRQGRPDVYPTPEEAAEYRFTPLERQMVEDVDRLARRSVTRDGARRPRGAGRAHRCRRAHGHDDGARARRAGGVVRRLADEFSLSATR